MSKKPTKEKVLWRSAEEPSSSVRQTSKELSTVSERSATGAEDGSTRGSRGAVPLKPTDDQGGVGIFFIESDNKVVSRCFQFSEFSNSGAIIQNCPFRLCLTWSTLGPPMLMVEFNPETSSFPSTGRMLLENPSPQCANWFSERQEPSAR